jgi:poly(A) polymerase
VSEVDALLAAVRQAAGERRAWLVGGAVRDRLLERVDPAGPPELDVVVERDVRGAARALARAERGAAFELSEAFGAWRVVGRGQAWQVDLAPLHGGSLQTDLGARDLTINALAEPLGGGPLVDLHGGLDDLERRCLRMVAPGAFAADPLRALRLARLAVELRFAIDPDTAAAAREHAAEVAGVAQERVFAELSRIVTAPGAVEGMALMDDLGLTEAVLPEVAALRGVQQSDYHHRDVHGHTLEVLAATVDLEADPTAVVGEELAAATRALLAEPLADGLTRGGALRFGALLHDAAKPQTRIELPGGRIGFPDHDRLGAGLARAALARLRASARLRAHVAGLARHHLRLGFLVHEAPLPRRTLHAYLRACGDVAADVTLLSVADRLATRGRKADVAIARHLELARLVLAEALSERAVGSRPRLIRGDDLATELGLTPGPVVGRLLAELDAAAFAGEVRTREQAIEHARRVLRRDQAAARRDAT